MIPATNGIVQEFADILATIARASADNSITMEEAKTIRRRWEELKSVTEGFVKAAESGNDGPIKAADEKTPVGDKNSIREPCCVFLRNPAGKLMGGAGPDPPQMAIRYLR